MRARVIQRRHVKTIASSIVGFYGAMAVSIGAVPGLWMPSDVWLLGRAAEDAAWGHALAVARICAIGSSVALVIAAIAPYFVLAWRPRASECTIAEGHVKVGIHSFHADAVTGFSVAPDGHGVSVALGIGDQTTFLEVDTMNDARLIATALKKRFPADGELRLTLPSQSPSLVVAMFSFVALVLAGLLPFFTGFSEGLIMIWSNTITLTVLLAILVIMRTRKPMKLSWGTATQIEPTRTLDRSPIERHVRRHERARLTAPPVAPRVRVDLLAQGNDSVGEWLKRIDALDRAGGYRGENAPSELLFETVKDDHAPIDVRLAAARLLKVRDNEDRMRIADTVTDADIRARILAVTDEHPEAALAEVGPLFRARN